MDKVKIFCDHSMTLREMTDNLPASGHFWTPPPHPLGLEGRVTFDGFYENSPGELDIEMWLATTCRFIK